MLAAQHMWPYLRPVHCCKEVDNLASMPFCAACSLLLYKAIQRKAQKWKGGAPKMEQQSVEVWMMYLGALKREYALVSGSGWVSLMPHKHSWKESIQRWVALSIMALTEADTAVCP
jgi:hypothetical protein